MEKNKNRNRILEEAALLCDDEVKILQDERLGKWNALDNESALQDMARKIRTLKKTKKTYFPNYAGPENNDAILTSELEDAGIKSGNMPEFTRKDTEVKTVVYGELHQWGFKRNWTYWVADGPGIPCDVATKLHEEFGQEVRVDGHCGCPSPLEWFKGFGVGRYHIDTVEGLKALADVIKGIYKTED